MLNTLFLDFMTFFSLPGGPSNLPAGCVIGSSYPRALYRGDTTATDAVRGVVFLPFSTGAIKCAAMMLLSGCVQKQEMRDIFHPPPFGRKADSER